MPIWSFVDFLEANGSNPVRVWFVDEIPDGARATIDGLILRMQVMPLWPPKWTSDYQGIEGVFEIRVPFSGVQYRPFAMFSPATRRQVVLLCGAIERGGKIRRSILHTIARRRDELRKEPFRVGRHQLSPRGTLGEPQE
jgi:hypothetical protein